MSGIERLQAALEARRCHFSAFLILGDPDPDASVELALTAVAAGATMLEVGLPFSDPCADGPAIQRSVDRARAAGVSTGEALEVLVRIHEALPDVPLNLLVYGNLVHAPGYDAFCRRAAAAGAATILVPDIPLEESGPLRRAAADHGLGYVALVAPSTDASRLAALDAATTGFLYFAGYQGVTGRAAGIRAPSLRRSVPRVNSPVCLGFGVSTPEQVDAAFADGARIVVVGSHLARAVESALPGGICAARASLRDAVERLAAAVPDDRRGDPPGSDPTATPTVDRTTHRTLQEAEELEVKGDERCS